MGILSDLLRHPVENQLHPQRAEDPTETLDYSYEQMRDQLQEVKRGIADLTTQKSASRCRNAASRKTSRNTTSRLARPSSRTERTSHGAHWRKEDEDEPDRGSGPTDLGASEPTGQSDRAKDELQARIEEFRTKRRR